ncbi:MAG: hypothetical protein HUJ83_06450 [Veillonella sp.]|nr:hypothetical protein [Veillonella sp.]
MKKNTFFILLLSIFLVGCNIQHIEAGGIYGTYKPAKGGKIRLDIYEVNNFKESKTIELIDSNNGVDLYLFEWINKETGTTGRYLLFFNPNISDKLIGLKPIGTKKPETWIKVK